MAEKTLEDLWNEYQDRKLVLEEKFTQDKIKGKNVDDKKFHRLLKKLYDSFYKKSMKLINSENDKKLREIQKQNLLLKNQKGKFYEPQKKEEGQ